VADDAAPVEDRALPRAVARRRALAGLVQPTELAYGTISGISVFLPKHLSYVPSYPPGTTTPERELPGYGLPVETGPLPAGDDHVDVQVTVGTPGSGPVGARALLPCWSGTLRLKVRQVATVEEANAVQPLAQAGRGSATSRSADSSPCSSALTTTRRTRAGFPS
jgi:hypothetical protein